MAFRFRECGIGWAYCDGACENCGATLVKPCDYTESVPVKKITYADKVRSMTDEELALQFASAQADVCKKLGETVGMPLSLTREELESAADEWLALLKQEVANEGH